MNMKILLLILVLASPAWAAINAASVWEIRTTGLDTNGGCWNNTGGSSTDYSQQDAPQLNLTDVTSNAAGTAWSSVAGGFTANMVGSCVRLTSGTNFTVGTYQITVYTSTNAVTVDRDSTSGASASAGNINVGGALLTPGFAGGLVVASNVVYIKAGTPAACGSGSADYCVTTASTNVAAGCLSPASTTTWVGYTSTRTKVNTDTRPIIQAGNSIATFTLFGSANSSVSVINLSFDGSDYTAATGVSLTGTLCRADRVKADNTTVNGISMTQGSSFGQWLEATSFSGTSGIASATCFGCVASDGTTLGISVTDCVNCIADSNTGATTDGITALNACIGCVAYANGRNGFTSNSNRFVCINCIAENNVGQAFVTTAAAPLSRLINGAGYNNCTGGGCSGNDYNSTNQTFVVGFVAVSAGSVFTNAAGGDFSLNNTASQGALLRATGYPATFPGGTASYRDIGAAQHQDAGGAAVTRAYPFVQ